MHEIDFDHANCSLDWKWYDQQKWSNLFSSIKTKVLLFKADVWMFTKLDSLLDFIESDEYANFSLWKPKYVVYFHDLEIIVAFPENHFNVKISSCWINWIEKM